MSRVIYNSPKRKVKEGNGKVDANPSRYQADYQYHLEKTGTDLFYSHEQQINPDFPSLRGH
jgi:hypothetical protein